MRGVAPGSFGPGQARENLSPNAVEKGLVPSVQQARPKTEAHFLDHPGMRDRSIAADEEGVSAGDRVLFILAQPRRHFGEPIPVAAFFAIAWSKLLRKTTSRILSGP